MIVVADTSPINYLMIDIRKAIQSLQQTSFSVSADLIDKLLHEFD